MSLIGSTLAGGGEVPDRFRLTGAVAEPDPRRPVTVIVVFGGAYPAEAITRAALSPGVTEEGTTLAVMPSGMPVTDIEIEPPPSLCVAILTVVDSPGASVTEVCEAVMTGACEDGGVVGGKGVDEDDPPEPPPQATSSIEDSRQLNGRNFRERNMASLLMKPASVQVL